MLQGSMPPFLHCQVDDRASGADSTVEMSLPDAAVRGRGWCKVCKLQLAADGTRSLTVASQLQSRLNPLWPAVP